MSFMTAENLLPDSRQPAICTYISCFSQNNQNHAKITGKMGPKMHSININRFKTLVVTILTVVYYGNNMKPLNALVSGQNYS